MRSAAVLLSGTRNATRRNVRRDAGFRRCVARAGLERRRDSCGGTAPITQTRIASMSARALPRRCRPMLPLPSPCGFLAAVVH